MTRMFSERINEFVLSIGIMDDDTFIGLLKLIATYVSNHLNVTYFSVLTETTINDQQGLKTFWSTREEPLSYTVDKEIGYTSHTAFTFGNKRPIWVVSESTKALQQADDLKDLWEDGAKNLPAYSKRSQEPVRTSVMHPLTKDGRAFGVIEFASSDYVEPTPTSLDEIRTLASIISRGYQMHDIGRIQRENTKHAMQILEQALTSQLWRRLALPQLFVAYPGGERNQEENRPESEEVIETIIELLDDFKNIINVIYWKDITEPGNINDQVIRDIGNSDFGLCYFSEPTQEGRFQDNANVLFEAGMMQALANSTSALLRSWIPIREKDSAAIPFDITSERIVLVHRTDGKLDKESFAGALREHVLSMLRTPTKNGR